MSKLRETYKWIDEFNDKKLTAPPGGTRFIEIAFDGEVRALSVFKFTFFSACITSNTLLIKCAFFCCHLEMRKQGAGTRTG